MQNDLVHGWGLDFALRKCVEVFHLPPILFGFFVYFFLNDYIVVLVILIECDFSNYFKIFKQPAHEKIGVVDSQWIVHQTVPSLGSQVNIKIISSTNVFPVILWYTY